MTFSLYPADYKAKRQLLKPVRTEHHPMIAMTHVGCSIDLSRNASTARPIQAAPFVMLFELRIEIGFNNQFMQTKTIHYTLKWK